MLSTESLWKKASTDVLTTGIGSLPHPYIDAALQFSLSHSIPFLPQLPGRNPNEFMVFQTLEGIVGLSQTNGGLIELEPSVWEAHRDKFDKMLDKAFSISESNWAAFDRFEPGPAYWSCWKPFLWELEERRIPFAKIQLVGPMTAQWAIRLKDGSIADRNSRFGMQVFRLVMARAIDMCRRLRAMGVVPLVFVDEPGFYGFSSANSKQKVALEELRLFLQTLKKEEALVGVHCCSNTEWATVMALPIDVLSIDVSLSLPFVVKELSALELFVHRGGRLALGIIPTGAHALKIRSFEPALLWHDLLNVLKSHISDRELVRNILSNAIYTPACGLALHSVQDAEAILSHLNEVGGFVRNYR